MYIINCLGLTCPAPVIKTKKYFDSTLEGEAEIIVDNKTALENVSKLCKNSGIEFKSEEDKGIFHIYAKKIKNISSEVMDLPSDTLILIDKAVLGSGDDRLGEILIKSYMYALSESDKIPNTLIFINGGVKLTTEGSAVTESLKSLEDKGVNILSCGTCLDFYNLKDKLLVGKVTNMYTIAEEMNKADNTIVL